MFGQGWGQTTGAFGQPAEPAGSGTTGFGQPSAFGATQPEQSAFGATQNTTTPGFGTFGQQPKPTFGATGGIFGQPAATTAATATPAFGGFGAATGTTAGFGTTNTGGLFGNKPATTTTTTPLATTGFGPTTAATIHGTASPPDQVTSEKEGTLSTTYFGQLANTTGGFGATNTTTGGLFGQNNQQQPTAAKGSKTPHVTAKHLPSSSKEGDSTLAESASADHMGRANKSVRRSQHQSMIREYFSSSSPENHLAYLSSYPPRCEVKTSFPAAKDEESTPPGAADPLPVVPISQTWQFSSAMRIKANLEYQTPDNTRIKFPMAAAESLLFFASPEDGEIALADLFKLSDAKEIAQDWLHSLILYTPLLRAVARVAELITPFDGVLDPKSPCARVMDFLLDNYPISKIMPTICSPSVDGTVALRHVVRRTQPASAFPPASSSPGHSSPQQSVLIPLVLDHACNMISKSGADSVASIHAFRLVEATLSRIHTLDDMQQAPLRYVAQSITHLLKNKDLRREGERPGVDAARRGAAMQLMSAILKSYKRLIERIEAESEIPEISEKVWLLQDIALSDIVQYLQDDEADPMVRCMALRVIHDFASVYLDEVPQWVHLEDVVGTCAEVMLRKTTWQHDHELKAKSLDLVGFCPHDDAYHILSFVPTELAVRSVSKALAVDNKVKVLEPLIALIVDHSTLKDGYWPFMLSILIHSGCLSLFHDILNQPVQLEEDADDQTTCKATSNACIGLKRCFEQMRARDMKAVPSDLSLTLEKLSNDDGTTSLVRSSASAALMALNENVMPSFEISLRASLRSKTPADSAPRPPQHDSSATI